VGKLDGKVAVITGATSGMALAGAKLFVDEGAHVFISGRRKDALDEAVKLIGGNVTGVQGDAANLDDLDRSFETVNQEKGAIDVLWASAGMGEQGRLGEITGKALMRCGFIRPGNWVRAIASRLQPVSSEFVLALPETSPVERVRSRTGQRP
jgi:NAD(P)-dependent dehydrogenase (short-subunit alcohol dehydrogenase family)